MQLRITAHVILTGEVPSNEEKQAEMILQIENKLNSQLTSGNRYNDILPKGIGLRIHLS